ncbi:hypothetical protein [Desulfoscipio gibsoniae]|uniref:Uncharacterized protein n=1 Tax=Desulfoscipio gibsoniae DSM 7213 TaxID=767817 RepID=R4KKT3_9FIRM|nr:hypothetical protein [Desulfoscipio gibsoniae]AGL01125.1 hypothetical protein Desgi_1654 [Desulfoscipio gibsoniae DSM 7213]
MDNDKFQELVLQQFQVITGELKILNKRVGNLEEGQARLEKSQDILVTEVIAIKSKTNEIDTKLTKQAVRVENEIEPKINTLFAGHKQHTEQLARIEERINNHTERLDSIEIDTGYLVSRVARLEKIAK